MQYFFLILQLIPSIFALIRQVEIAIPQPGQGPAKLNMVLAGVQAAAADVPEIANVVKEHDWVAAITRITNAAVSALNAAGVFNKP
jgi:hypothetical protein